MRKLMCVVAPQHYIDDDAVEYNRDRVEYTKPTPSEYATPTMSEYKKPSEYSTTRLSAYYRTAEYTPYSSRRPPSEYNTALVDITSYTCVSPSNQDPHQDPHQSFNSQVMSGSNLILVLFRYAEFYVHFIN